MFQAYDINKEDFVLLVGEGNFSFTIDFINLIKKTLQNECCCNKFITTCRESQFETFSEFKKKNINYLLDQGVSVLFNVDATKLRFVPLLQNKKFTKVIFNFPHVGGKMKIHLNRNLLKDFFSSACDVLDSNGSIVVALCDGQGGTEADKKTRRWDDCWQITEMAAQSDLILRQVEPFDTRCFPQYVNNGFRSGEKSFHCNNAVVHTFKKQNLPHILQDCPNRWLRDRQVREDDIFKFLEESMVNPFSNPQSASSFVFDVIKKGLGSDFYLHNSVLEHSNTVNSNSETEMEHCSGNRIKSQSLSDIYQTLNKGNVGNNIIARLFIKNVTLKDFSIAPVVSQMLVFGEERHMSVILEILSNMLELFKCDKQINVSNVDKETQCAYICNENGDHCKNINIVELIMLKNGINCHMCNLDALAQVLFRIVDWRSLWNGNVDCSHLESPTFCPISLFPRYFSFDLGLSIPLNYKDNFEEKLFLGLWLIAGDIITRVEQLTTYLPTDRDLICFCYRVTYMSFNAPLHRKRVIYIHEKIIAPNVAKFLKANIT